MHMKRNIFFAVLLMIIGAVVALTVQRHWGGMTMTTSAGMAAEKDAGKKIIAYRHPMNPAITSDKPLKDEMGMDYTPIYADEGNGSMQDDPSAVKISPAVVNNMGVRTARVERGVLPQQINTVGYVSYNEDQLHHVHLRAEGWVEHLAVKFMGARVQHGDLLFELYSPKLVNAQQEFLQALSFGNKGLLTASRQRLRALDIPDDQIARLEKTRKLEQRIQVYAHGDGVVRELNIREGMFVEPSTEAMSLVDLSSVWVLVDVFEQQAEWVTLGQEAKMRITALPGRVWQGKVDYIYPSLDPTTRTLKVRLRFDNPDELLKPNMYADVNIAALGNSTASVTLIPPTARLTTSCTSAMFSPKRAAARRSISILI